MFTKNNFIEAYFPDDKRNVITVIYQEKENRIPYFVKVDPDLKDFQKLLEITSLDEIEECTNARIQAEWNAIEAIQKRILEAQSSENKKEDDNLSFTQIFRFFLFFDSEEINGEVTNEERLFSLKIACFDIEEVENGSDELKEQIRNAQTPLELLNVIHDNIHNEKPDS